MLKADGAQLGPQGPLVVERFARQLFGQRFDISVGPIRSKGGRGGVVVLLCGRPDARGRE